MYLFYKRKFKNVILFILMRYKSLIPTITLWHTSDPLTIHETDETEGQIWSTSLCHRLY